MKTRSGFGGGLLLRSILSLAVLGVLGVAWLGVRAGVTAAPAGVALVVHPQEWFVRVTDSDVVKGVGFQGSGWADYDGDGDLDLFVCSLTAGGVLYRNDGGGVLTKTTGVLPIPAGASQGCAWGDYDNDGYPDLFVANRDGRNNYLFHNRGNGTFERITTGAIVNDGGDSVACAWADYDRDGFLDLFVADLSAKNSLYHNEGNGTFRKITTGRIVNDMANTVGCAWGDYDNDGYPDLFVANGGGNDNALYRNLGNGTFEKIITGSIVHDGGYSVGCAWGDYNNDGWMDLFVANRLGKDFLYRNNGDGSFTRVTEGELVNDGVDSNGAAWGDFDNDGYLDLFVANQGTNFLYRNRGDGTFERITGITNQGYAAAWGDYDKDGFVDLFVSDWRGGGNSQLYHNTGNGNAWVTICCEGTKSNRSGIGARVKLKTVVEGSERWQIRDVSSGDGWRDNGPYANFGLGAATAIDAVLIEWPSGTLQVLRNVAINQMLLVKETPPALVIRPDDGRFNYHIEITMVTTLADGVIHYTLDGAEPTANSAAYQGPIPLDRSASVKARVYVRGEPASDTLTTTYSIVLTAPEIATQPQSRTVLAGETVFLGVAAVGTPPLAFEWFHGQQSVANATNAVLTLTNVQSNDAGTYMAKVSNPLGSATSQVARVVVGYALNLTTVGPGTLVANPVATVYEPGATVELTATPAAGRSFLGWHGDATGLMNPLLLTIEGHKRVVAEFSRQPGEKKWEFPTGSDPIISCPALGADGQVYVGAANRVYALDGATGLQKWAFEPGEGVNSSPAIGADGTVYIGAAFNVYALDGATGARRWKFQRTDGVSSSPAIDADGTVYVLGSLDGKIYALDGVSGKKKWVFPAETGLWSSPVIGAEGAVYVGLGARVYALDGATGAWNWEFQVGNGRVCSPAIGADGTVYISSSSAGSQVCALGGEAGTKKWGFPTGGGVFDSPAIGADGTVYVGSADGQVYALSEATGAKEWEFKTGGIRSTPAIGVDGTLYVSSTDGKLYALEAASGATKWTFSTGGGVSSPTIGADGTVYLGSQDGKVYAVASSSVGGLADSPWPKYKADARNTGRLIVAPRFGRGFYSRVWLEESEQAVSVQITGAPTPTLQWYFNSQPIAGATNAALSIASVKASDEGIYTVVARNALGQASSRPIHVFVSNIKLDRYPGLELAASAGTTSQIDYTPLVGAGSGWFLLTNVVLTGKGDLFIDFSGASAPQRFYRATGVNRLGLGLYNAWEWNAPAGTRYQVDYIDIGSGSTNWEVLTNLTLTTNPQSFIDYGVTNAVRRSYRATRQP